MWVVAFVHFDDDESAGETYDAGQLDGSVDACSLELLLRGCSGLENQCGLSLKEERGDSEKLW